MIRNSFFEGLLQIRPDGFITTIPGSHWCLTDHVVRSHRVLPAVAYLEMVLAGIGRTHPAFRPASIEDCFWMRPLVSGDSPVSLLTRIRQVGRRLRFDIADADQSYACGWVSEVAPTSRTDSDWTRIESEVVTRGPRIVSAASAYATFSDMGIDYGPEFRNITEVKTAGLMAVAEIEPQSPRGMNFSTLLDCAFQSGMTIRTEEHVGSLMPFSLGCIVLHSGAEFIEQDLYIAATEKLSIFRTNVFIIRNGLPIYSVLDLGAKVSNLVED